MRVHMNLSLLIVYELTIHFHFTSDKECISDGTEYKSRRQPQKLIEESMAATAATDQEQLGIDFIPSDSEEDEGNNRSDESLTDLYPGEWVDESLLGLLTEDL